MTSEESAQGIGTSLGAVVAQSSQAGASSSNWTYHDELSKNVREYVGARVPVLPLLASDCDNEKADHQRPNVHDPKSKDTECEQR